MPNADPRQKAETYMEKHKVLKLFEVCATYSYVCCLLYVDLFIFISEKGVGHRIDFRAPGRPKRVLD